MLDRRPYRAFGKAAEAFMSKEPEVLISGPAGTGKSRACLEKIHFLCEKYPNTRILIARKTRASLTETILPIFELHVVPEGHSILNGADRQNRLKYTYPNGSVIVLGGFDKVVRLMSGEYDLIYIPEAIEVTKDDWELVSTRLRNNRLPFQQMLGDTNPDSPSHWLYQRWQKGLLKILFATHQDNPRFWNPDRKDWTPEGVVYLEKLGRLTGSRRSRMLMGKWEIAEGARFPNFDPSKHLFDVDVLWKQTGVPQNLTKLIGLDYGLAAPYCALWHAIDSEGNVYTYREDYKPGFTADQQVGRVITLSPENEKYYAEYLDPAFWQRFPQHQGPSNISAHSIYQNAIDEENKRQAILHENDRAWRKQFGPLLKGYNADAEFGMMTLDKLLNEGKWYIDRSCENLRKEIESAVFFKHPKTALFEERLDPQCADHALKAAVYSLHTHLKLPVGDTRPPTEDEMEAARLKKRHEQSKKNFRKRFRHMAK